MATKSVALDNAIEKAEANKLELEAGIGRERKQIAMFQEYIDGVKEHPFSVPDLEKGITQSHKNIQVIQETIIKQSGDIDALRQQLEDAIRETKHIIIELTARGPTIRQSKQSCNSPDS